MDDRLKCRAWDGKKFLYSDKAGYDHFDDYRNLGFFFEAIGDGGHFNLLNLNQCTGIKDKISSRLIFDDDIVDWWFNDGSIRCLIKWNENDCKFGLYPFDSFRYGHSHNVYKTSHLSYVGNIHEHPELLKTNEGKVT